MMKIAEDSTIIISYIGKLDNGHVFKEVPEDAPVTITLGKHELPPTIEAELIGLSTGESKTVRVPPDEGYGARQKMLVQDLSMASFSDGIKPKPGMILSLKVSKDGVEEKVPATVIEVTEDKVVVDYNHPLAGHHLTYEMKILSIN